MTSLNEAFDKLIEEQEALQRKFQTQAQSLFKDITKEFFEKNTHVKAIIWNQYTPYFNDGEECVFSVNDPTYTNAEGEDLDDISSWGEYEGEKDDIWTWEGWGSAPEGIDIKPLQEFSAIVCSEAMTDVMRAMFGDHVTIRATKDGFSVDEYDHD